MNKFIILFTTVFFVGIPVALGLGDGDRLDLAITPIRQELQVTGSTAVPGSVILYNNSDKDYSFYLSAEDCTVTEDYKAPLCTSPTTTSSVSSLSKWIEFTEKNLFTVKAKSNKKITYTIKAPSNATPGGHYGAIFFNSPDTSGGGTISMNRRIGSLLLVSIPGDVVVNPEFGVIQTVGNGGGSSAPINPTIYTTTIELLSPSNTGSLTDNFFQSLKNFQIAFTDPMQQKLILDFINPIWKTPTLDTKKEFITSVKIPVNNKGNIHISPKGKITLYEKNGTQLTRIGKEYIKNQNGALVGEKVVDYLPINEEGNNVLPNTSRWFSIDWKGFARETIKNDGSIEILYESPGVYYSQLAMADMQFVYPWEKLSVQKTTKELDAKVELGYVHPVTKKEVSQTSFIPLTVQYDEIVKTLNTGALTIMGLLLFGTLIILVSIRREKGSKKIKKLHVSSNDEIAILEIAQKEMNIKPKKVAAPTRKKITPKALEQKDEVEIKAPKKTRTKSTIKATPVKKSENSKEQEPTEPTKTKSPRKKRATQE